MKIELDRSKGQVTTRPQVGIGCKFYDRPCSPRSPPFELTILIITKNKEIEIVPLRAETYVAMCHSSALPFQMSCQSMLRGLVTRPSANPTGKPGRNNNMPCHKRRWCPRQGHSILPIVRTAKNTSGWCRIHCSIRGGLATNGKSDDHLTTVSQNQPI
jgi:hypothetical protein